MSRGTRTSRSLLSPGMTVAPGSAYCCSCPWAVIDDQACETKARDHTRKRSHPTVSKPPTKTANLTGGRGE